MSEIFTITCNNVSVSAVQDVLAAYATATKKLRYLSARIGVNGQTTVGNYPIRVYRIVATVTAGSGGTTPTPKNVNPNGAAPSFTAHANDTTQATGTVDPYISDQLNPINGWYDQPPTREAGKWAELSDAIVLSLDGISGTVNVSATLMVEEV